MGRKLTYIKKTEDWKKAIIKSGGIMSHIAKEMGCTRRNVYAKIENNPDLKELLEEQRELLIDESESVIKNSILIDQNVETAKWYLKNAVATKYNEKIQITANVNVNAKVDLNSLSGEELLQLEQLIKKTSNPTTGGSGDMQT